MLKYAKSLRWLCQWSIVVKENHFGMIFAPSTAISKEEFWKLVFRRLLVQAKWWSPSLWRWWRQFRKIWERWRSSSCHQCAMHCAWSGSFAQNLCKGENYIVYLCSPSQGGRGCNQKLHPGLIVSKSSLAPQLHFGSAGAWWGDWWDGRGRHQWSHQGSIVLVEHGIWVHNLPLYWHRWYLSL